MAIKYDKLFRLIQARGKTEYYLRQHGISSSILERLKNERGGFESRTIDKLCRLLDCQPGDIMEYVEEKAPENNDVLCPPESDKKSYTE